MIEKYYIPQIEEFHIGMEYEIASIDNCWNIHGWIKKVVDEKFNYENVKEYLELYRIKYLDEADLIELGWIKDKSYFKIVEGYYDKDDDLTGFEYNLRLYSDRVFITNYTICYGKADRPYEGDEYIFKGQIKNKTEMKKLMQMLNIKPPKTN